MKKSPDERHTWKINQNVSTITDVFVNWKRVNVCEHTVKMASCESFWKVCHEGVVREEGKCIVLRAEWYQGRKNMVTLTISSGNQVTPCCNQPSRHIQSYVPRWLYISPVLVGPKMESEVKQKWDGDSPVERNPQRDGQEGVKANIPQVAYIIKRLHLEQKKLSSREEEGSWSS